MNENNKEETKSCKKDKILNILLDKKTIFGVIIFTFVLFFIFCCVDTHRQNNLVTETQKYAIENNITENQVNQEPPFSIKKQENKQQNNEIKKQPSVIFNKSDILGHWDDLYSQRAYLSISDLGRYIKVEVNWSSSALENSKWIFECQYNNTSNLTCKNGAKIETYPVKNGVRMYGAVTIDGEEPDGIEEKTINQNLQATIDIKKGNLKEALNEISYFGDKNEAMNSFENITLKINSPDLSKCIFAKAK